MVYIISIIIIAIVQLIYVKGTDLPFYYKEIIYDWNYTSNESQRFKKSEHWVEILNEKGYSIISNEPHTNHITIQTDLFSHQQHITIHEHLNTVMLTAVMILILYIANVTINTILYTHEKKRMRTFIITTCIFLFITIYTYNIELLTSILYKTNFLYTDNIYVNNNNEYNTKWVYVLYIISLVCYLTMLKKKKEQRFVRYNAYLIFFMLNVINENTMIGLEYIYIVIYLEIVMLICHVVLNIKK